jgi:hypothetical protein
VTGSDFDDYVIERRLNKLHEPLQGTCILKKMLA